MALATPQTNLSGLARKLVQDGVIEEGIAAQAQNEAVKKKKPFVGYLVEKNWLMQKNCSFCFGRIWCTSG